MHYCSLQHRILLPSSVNFPTGCCFCFGSFSSFFLNLFPHWSLGSILGTYWPGEFIFQCPIFLPFHTVHKVLKARILKWFAFSSLVDHVLSELSTITCPSWVVLYGIELDKAVDPVISLVSFLWSWFSFCLPLMRRIRDLRKLPNGRDWLRGKLGLVLMGRSMLSKSLIQISVDGRACVPSLLFDLRPNYGGHNEDDGDLLQKVPCKQCSRPPQVHAPTRDSWTLTGKSGSISCEVTAPFSHA